MTKLKIGRFAACLTAIGALVFLAGDEYCALASEPIYQGQPESYWVNQLTNKLNSYSLGAISVKLGSNALPVLVKAVKMNSGDNAAIIRTNAAFLLAQNADPRTLVSIANDTCDSQVKLLVLNGLIRNTDPDVVSD